jgi:hypothetical protein
VRNKRVIIIGGVLAALLLLSLLLVGASSTPQFTVGVLGYSSAKKGGQPSIIITLTNQSLFPIPRIDHVEIEEISSNGVQPGMVITDRAGLYSWNADRIEVPWPKPRGKWRVGVFTCPSWRKALDSGFTRKLHLRFFYATYAGFYSDWIDD